MRAVNVLFDTLSRRFISTYGNTWVPTPNFERLARKCTVMDNFYCGSTPCMPARRDMQTGRLNFLHRGWGPLEPFDDSCIEILKNNGIYTHIVTDHSHYWEDGGATYVQRFNSWEGFRGQEGDRWQPALKVDELEIPKLAPTAKKSISLYHNYANRLRQKDEASMSTVRTVNAGIDFLNRYRDLDNWFLQIECFDPHEPFIVPQRFLDLVDDHYTGDRFDWPTYGPVREPQEQKEHLIKRYAALIAMCDHYLGKVLDVFDKYDLWQDTLLIVHTDHGFLMGEHDWWGKNIQPHYQEIIHLPFYIHTPGQKEGKRCDFLTQTIDLAPTWLEHFKLAIPETVQGRSILTALRENKPIREYGLCGMFGAQVNLITKDYIYMRTCKDASNSPLYMYTLMPTNMRGFFDRAALAKATLTTEFSFTHHIPVLKVPSLPSKHSGMFGMMLKQYGNLLFDLKNDYHELHPLKDAQLEAEMIAKLVQGLEEAEADAAQFDRLGLLAYRKDNYEH